MKRFGFFIGSLIAILAMVVMLVPAMAVSEGTIRMNMKFYGNHNSTVDARIRGICPEYLIDNPPHGLYGERDHQLEGYDYDELDYLLQDVEGMQEAGIKVIGYITSGYEGTGGDDGYDPYWYSLELNEMLIENMIEIDGVDGIFIDECTDYPNADSKEYLTALTDLIHSYGHDKIAWGNVGVDDFDEWFFHQGHFDYMQSTEAWVGQELSDVQEKWGFQISVTRFKKSYTAQDAYDLTVDAWGKGLAFCYVNNKEYTSIAPWFEDYIDMLWGYLDTALMEGDVTLDKHVSATDAMFIAQWVVGLRELSDDQLICADTYDDGEVSIADAMHISQWIVDPTGDGGVLTVPLWESPADDDLLPPMP